MCSAPAHVGLGAIADIRPSNAFEQKMREILTEGACGVVERNNYFTGEPVTIPIEP